MTAFLLDWLMWTTALVIINRILDVGWWIVPIGLLCGIFTGLWEQWANRTW